MNRPCTIIIPCYNEETRFPFDRFAGFVAANPAIRFLLVDDGSKDKTLAVLRRARAGREDQVDVIAQPVNGGKGEAVRSGVLAALRRYLVDEGFLDREASVYWRSGGSVASEST